MVAYRSMGSEVIYKNIYTHWWLQHWKKCLASSNHSQEAEGPYELSPTQSLIVDQPCLLKYSQLLSSGGTMTIPCTEDRALHNPLLTPAFFPLCPPLCPTGLGEGGWHRCLIVAHVSKTHSASSPVKPREDEPQYSVGASSVADP